MKKMVTKAMGIMFLLALTITVNAGVVGTIPQGDNGGITVMSDEPSYTDIQF